MLAIRDMRRVINSLQGASVGCIRLLSIPHQMQSLALASTAHVQPEFIV